MEAGLPNITGTYANPNIRGAGTTVKGAFTLSSLGKSAPNAGQLTSHTLNLDASLSNTVYGSSDTITPESLTTSLLIKY